MSVTTPQHMNEAAIEENGIKNALCTLTKTVEAVGRRIWLEGWLVAMPNYLICLNH